MRSNVSIGKGFETEFDYRMKEAGALVIPQYVASKFVKRGRLVNIGTAWPDRVCAIHSLMFITDLKSTKNKKRVQIDAGFDANTSRKKYDQFLKLQLADEYGVFSFYLVEWRAHNDIALYPVNKDSEWKYTCDYYDGIHIGSEQGWAEDLCFEVYKFYGKED